MAKQFPETLVQGSYELLLNIVDARADSNRYHVQHDMDRAEAAFHDLCAEYNLNPDEVFAVFHKASDPLQLLTTSERALLRTVSHPTILDLPTYYPDHVQRWRDLTYLIPLANYNPANDVVSPNDAILLFNSFFEGGKRALLQGLDLDTLSDEQILRTLRNRIYAPDLGEHGGVVELPDEATTINVGSIISQSRSAIRLRRNITRYDYDHDFWHTTTTIDRDYLKAVQSVREDYITFAKGSAISINAFMSYHRIEGKVTPRDVFDTFHSHGPIQDPFLFAWASKLAEDTDENKPQSLQSYWAEMPAHMKPEDDRAIQAILAKLDSYVPMVEGDKQTPRLQFPAFTMAQVAQHFVVREQELRDFLMGSRTYRKAWKATDAGTWEPIKDGIFETLWRFMDYEKPEHFLPPPAWQPQVKSTPVVASADRPLPPPVDPFADAKAIFGDDFKPDELIKKALALVSSNKGQARITVDLQEALKHPSRYLRSDGLPSLPHLLLMRAHKGDVNKDMSIDAVSAALQKTFDPKGDAYVPPQRNGYRAFVWTLLQDAQAKGKPIASYADLLAAYDFKQDYGVKQQDKVEVINPDRNSADGMANRILGYVNDLFARAAVGEDLTSERDTQLIAKMVAVAGDIMNEKDQKNVAFVAFLGPIARPARKAAANIRQAFLTPKKG